MEQHSGACPGCRRHCSLKHPRCNQGRRFAQRLAEGNDRPDGSYTPDGFLNPDYGQHDYTYDSEGFADPEAHDFPELHHPRPRQRNWDLDSDEDFIGDSAQED
ncbi:MAG: hypothetical protein Q4E12_04765 [Coriobacteriia bacterium]|nr:hypothetical protein [Coriobacteriia bacterium]